jgi:hypothetical protein
MDDQDTVDIDVDVDVDDEFERLGRLAGAELRRPAPADGPGTVLRSAHRRRTTTAMVAAGVTVAVVATGLFVTSSRSQDEPAPIAPVPPSPATVVTIPPSSAPVDTVPPSSAPVDTVPPSSAPEASVLTPATNPATSSATSGGMWPQSTLQEVQAAQQRADAGDPDATWQIGTELSLDDPWANIDELEIIDRFLLKVLGWEDYLFNSRDSGDEGGGGGDGWVGGLAGDLEFLRCAPGITNPLYPPNPDGRFGTPCAPTIDDLHYESVRIDLAQLDRHGLDGIWVVNEWTMTAPFRQADPAVVEAQATERVHAFLAARLAGQYAEGYVQVEPDVDVPLLYATSSGAPYERYEVERATRPLWPDGRMTFSARLFADGDATMVEQDIDWRPSEGLWIDAHETTENGQPIMLSYTSDDGEVTVAAPSAWRGWLPGKAAGRGGHEQALDVWFGSLWHLDENFGSGERIELVDPVAYDAWCADNGGSPLLTAPANAAEITQQLIADPDFETTAPVSARVGGVEAVSIDVSLAPGGEPCGVGMIEISRWVHTIGWDPGWRLRLYLVDLPEGMSVETLAITVVAPDDRFDAVIAETAPIIDSIEFHPG